MKGKKNQEDINEAALRKFSEEMGPEECKKINAVFRKAAIEIELKEALSKLSDEALALLKLRIVKEELEPEEKSSLNPDLVDDEVNGRIIKKAFLQLSENGKQKVEKKLRNEEELPKEYIKAMQSA